MLCKDIMDVFEILFDVATIITAIAAVVVSVRTNKLQREFNMLSFMPVCELYTANFGDCFSVEIQNKGAGLMRIKEMTLTSKENVTFDNLPDFVPEKDQLLYSFNFVRSGKTLMSGETVYLIMLKSFTNDDRKHLIEALSDIQVHIEYEDVYLNNYVFDQPIEFAEWISPDEQ